MRLSRMNLIYKDGPCLFQGHRKGRMLPPSFTTPPRAVCQVLEGAAIQHWPLGGGRRPSFPSWSYCQLTSIPGQITKLLSKSAKWAICTWVPQNRWERIQSTHLLCQLSFSSFLHSYFCFFSLSLSFFLLSICQKKVFRWNLQHTEIKLSILNRKLEGCGTAIRTWESPMDLMLVRVTISCCPWPPASPTPKWG